MRRCPKCGFLLNENDRYCENCGEDCSAVEDSEVNEVVSLMKKRKS
ncbi:zinc-ribbon domain-containing protein [Ruminococcus bromii]|nr:zinc-ribbon domain-containing protein [Ruminococcus bromii]